ncbi:MAG: fluoride efflux transporter FluC [Frankiaceae bacterium]
MGGATPERGAPAASRNLPVDPDTGSASFEVARARWPRLRGDVVAVVFAGGCLGGLARYLVTSAWPAGAAGLPWSTLLVNVTGAFALAVLVVLVAEARPGRYVRPLAGTGFCGAYTTFSSVVVSVDLLAAHHRVVVAAEYLGLSALGGLAAAILGLVVARWAASLGQRRSVQ